jgi:hypothetical protein
MVEVEVLKSNKMGIYAVYENAIRLMVPRDLHLGDEEFDSLKVGDRINVEIQKSRFQLRDPFIVSVGIFRGAGSETQVKPPTQAQAQPPLNTIVESNEIPEAEAAEADAEAAEAEAAQAEGAEEEEEEEATKE